MSKLLTETFDHRDVEEAKRIDHHCAEKAKQRGQNTFTLVAQDRSSPRTIAFWILENIETAPPGKLYDALRVALLMREFENRKHPD